jgi:hypothetical protein
MSLRLRSRWCAVIVAATRGPAAAHEIHRVAVVMCSSTTRSRGKALDDGRQVRSMNTASRSKMSTS